MSPDDNPSNGDSSGDGDRTVRRRTVLGSLGVAGAGLVAGCSGNDPESTGNGGGGGDGGNGGGGDGGNGGGDGGGGGGGGGSTLVFADPERPSTLDPHAVDPSDTNASFAYPEQGYETLIFFSPTPDEVDLVPALATEVPSTENGLIDGRTVEFPLREGVSFHTGGEMTAEDVRYSWERSMTMGLGPGSDPLSSAVDSMEAVDDYTFRVTLAQNTVPIFLGSVVVDPAAAVVSKAAVEENGGFAEGQPNQWLAQNSAGTGPYMLGESTPNSLEWSAHEDYWDEAGITACEQRFIGDTASRVAQLGRGDLDYIYVSVGDTSELEGQEGINILSGPQLNPGGIQFNTNIPYDRNDVQQIAGDDTIPSDFFASRNVRKAFAHIVPWDVHIENVLDGFGSRINNIHMPGTFGYDPEAPRFEQDLDLVEELLREEGYWEDGFRLTLYNENISEFTRLNLLIKDEFESLNSNIRINSVQEPESRAVQRLGQNPVGWPAIVWGLLPVGVDPTPYYKYYAHPDGNLASKTGIPDVIDPRIPELIDQTEVETDPEARAEQFAELQRLCYDDPPAALGYAPEEVFPHRACIDSVWSSAWRRPHFKHWDASGC